jgi:hypothetical protein
MAWSPTLALLCVTIAGSDGGVWTSPDGVTFTQRADGITRDVDGLMPVDITSVQWSSYFGRFFISCSGDATGEFSILSSTDGIIWENASHTSAVDVFGLIPVDDSGVMVALTSTNVGSTGSTLFSRDGLTWETLVFDDTVHFSQYGTFAPTLGRIVSAGSGNTSSSIETYDMAGSNWRVGTIRLGVVEGGRR